jgi:hypothetical protein
MRGQRRPDEGLVESQGVNAVRPVDEETTAEENWLEVHPPTHDLRPSGVLSDEMVGLPQQLPGYPGLQRSIDTS